MTSHGSNAEGISAVVYIVKLMNSVQVDQHGRLGQPQGQKRHETLATGKKLGLVSKVPKQTECLIDTSGCVILEWSWLHRKTLL
jgi:hypothetical protein